MYSTLCSRPGQSPISAFSLVDALRATSSFLTTTMRLINPYIATTSGPRRRRSSRLLRSARRRPRRFAYSTPGPVRATLGRSLKPLTSLYPPSPSPCRQVGATTPFRVLTSMTRPSSPSAALTSAPPVPTLARPAHSRTTPRRTTLLRVFTSSRRVAAGRATAVLTPT